MDFNPDIQLRYNDTELVTPSAKKMTFFEDLYVDAQTETLSSGLRIKVVIHPKKDVVINELAIQLPYPFQANDRLFCNGYLSQSESLEFRPDDKMARPKPFSGSKWLNSGDYRHPLLKKANPPLHSWTYGYVRRQQNYLLIASLGENTGFSLIRYFCRKNVININLDIEQLQLSHSYPAMDILIVEGTEQVVFDQYAQLMGPRTRAPAPPLSCSLTASLPLDSQSLDFATGDNNPFNEYSISLDTIIFNKGYPLAMGDWADGQSGFPKGISSAATKIHQQGYKAGIWLAPFLCSASSAVYKNKKHWLLKDRKGKVVPFTDNSNKSRRYYILDYYNKEVTDYLISVFHSISEQWNYGLICFDLLHAVCLRPPVHKTAGQVMCEAMDFLQKQCDNMLIIAASVPLGAVMGKVDYCYISNHSISEWENKWLHWNQIRERNAAIPVLQTLINRRQLIGRMFQAAPAIVQVNQGKSFNLEQQDTILLINSLLGAGLLLPESSTSYTPEQWSEVKHAFSLRMCTLNKVELLDGLLYRIHFKHNNMYWVAYTNLSTKKRSFQHEGQTCELSPCESIVLKTKR